jgi:two-component system phosphate regulon sensor histidine kinase PhoR
VRYTAAGRSRGEADVLARMQWRIAIPYTILIGLCLLGLGAYLATFLRQFQLDQLRTQLAAEARLVGEVVEPAFAVPDATVRIQSMAENLGRQTDARVTIINRGGVVLGDSDQDPGRMENHADRPEVAAALATGAGESTRHSETIDRDMLYVAMPITSGGAAIGVARIAVPLDAVNASLNRVLVAIGTVLVLTAAVAVGLAVWIAGTVTDPLRQLTAATRRVARGGQPSPVQVPVGGEIGQLADAFNQMATELEVQVASLGRERDVLAGVLANMTDGILVVDHRRTVLLANEAAGRLLDVVEPPQGLSLARVVRDHEICDVLEQALAHGTRRAEVRRAGRHLRVAAAPLKDRSGGLLVLRDVTEERRVENLRRDFIANVSHELRTPIASLKALVETIEDGAMEDPPAARDFLGRMHIEVDGLAQLVQELLELSRVESGQGELDPQPVDPAELVRSAADRLRPQVERAGLTLRVETPPSPAPVVADRVRVEHVLLALLHNAVKFTPPGGAITLSVEPAGPQTRFSVVDTGVGIPAEDLPRIFERFYKVDRARSAGGTGLGLAIAKHVVRALGGRIWAESQVGRGTALRFTLPTAILESGAGDPRVDVRPVRT